jgi:hypothetical protein
MNSQQATPTTTTNTDNSNRPAGGAASEAPNAAPEVLARFVNVAADLFWAVNRAHDAIAKAQGELVEYLRSPLCDQIPSECRNAVRKAVVDVTDMEREIKWGERTDTGTGCLVTALKLIDAARVSRPSPTPPPPSAPLQVEESAPGPRATSAQHLTRAEAIKRIRDALK